MSASSPPIGWPPNRVVLVSAAAALVVAVMAGLHRAIVAK